MRLQSLLSALMVPFAVVAASAQAEAPRRLTLKSEVVVTSEVVRIGDLVENIGAGGDIAIFRSPDLGHTGSVPSEQIVEALRRHQVTNVDVRQINAVAVTRAGRAITPKDIEEALTTAIA